MYTEVVEKRGYRKHARVGDWVPDREELAWAAGFFDGEGSTSAQRWKTAKQTPRRIALQVGQAQPEELHRFQRAVGGIGAVRGPYVRQGVTSKKPMWRFQAGSFETVQAVGTMLWPWLCTVKREQFRRSLRTYREPVTS